MAKRISRTAVITFTAGALLVPAAPAAAHDSCYNSAYGPYTSPNGVGGKAWGWCDNQHQTMTVTATVQYRLSDGSWTAVPGGQSTVTVHNTGSLQEAFAGYVCVSGTRTYRIRAKTKAWNESGQLVHDPAPDFTSTVQFTC